MQRMFIIFINYAKNANYNYHNYEDTLDYVVRNHDFLINQLIAQA